MPRAAQAAVWAPETPARLTSESLSAELLLLRKGAPSGALQIVRASCPRTIWARTALLIPHCLRITP